MTSGAGGGAAMSPIDFEAFCLVVEPRLRRAFSGRYTRDRAADAVAEALGWAWDHRAELAELENTVGYLYRAGLTRMRARLQGPMELPSPPGSPLAEPGLAPALRALPERQRTAVWLIGACAFTPAEASAAMGVSRAAVGTHTSRGMRGLRRALKVRDADEGPT